MMSNCAFWCQTGELWAVHGVGADDPRASFQVFAQGLRLPPGRLITLSTPSDAVPAAQPGWQWVEGIPQLKRRKSERLLELTAAVAVAAPLLDEAAYWLMPSDVQHEKFRLRSWPTWVDSVRLKGNEGCEGWWAALGQGGKESRFLVRLVPYRGRLPGEGWRNMLGWVLRAHHKVKLVPLTGLPRTELLSEFPAWEYRVEAGRGLESAAWDIQVLPSRRLLAEWAPQAADAWEATAHLRWIRTGFKALPLSVGDASPREVWPQLWGRLPVADARRLVQNVLTTLPGGAAASAALFFESVTLAPDDNGRTLVRHVAQQGVPEALLSTLFGKRAWQEIERAKRQLPPEGAVHQMRTDTLAQIELRLREGRLVWTPEGLDLWEELYRKPQLLVLRREVEEFRHSARWTELLAGDHLEAEYVLRTLDVTDVALCLRDVPDARWRRFVTARREEELKAELEFCRVWTERGELTPERELDAWQSWDLVVQSYRAAPFDLTQR